MTLPVYLKDFTHESDIHESIVFYYFYFILQFYIYVSIGMILWAILDFYSNQNNLSALTFWDAVWENFFSFSVIPCIFASTISLIIIVKKKITQFNILLTAFLAMTIILFQGSGLGLFLSGLIPSLFMMCGDNNVYKYDKTLKLQLAEHDRKIKVQLEKEEIIRKLNKSEDRSENVLHIEITKDDDDLRRHRFNWLD